MWRCSAVILCLSIIVPGIAVAEQILPRLGKALSSDEVQAADSFIFPDGRGLPTGHGSVAAGEAIYHAQCLACHGAQGRGGLGGELAGGERDLSRHPPDKTIGTYWPYATTLFDFVRRAMPLTAPGSLSDDQVYALTAYLLHLNALLPREAALDPERLAALVMPNAHGFDWIDVTPDGSASHPGLSAEE